MRLWIVSDLHRLPYGPLWHPSSVPEHDVLILAGDITAPLWRTVVQARAMSDKPAVVVAGNHEYYGAIMQDELARARQEVLLHGSQVHLLENNAVVIGNTRLIGMTLWTDFELHGRANRGKAMQAALRGMNDYRMIACRNCDGDLKLFQPEDARAFHLRSRRYLARVLAKPHWGPTVVVTHHAPHPGSVHERWLGDPLTPAFASDMTGMIMRYQPTIWVHGHTHDSFDYAIGNTRIVCNPAGYGSENENFDPELVIVT